MLTVAIQFYFFSSYDQLLVFCGVSVSYRLIPAFISAQRLLSHALFHVVARALSTKKEKKEPVEARPRPGGVLRCRVVRRRLYGERRRWNVDDWVLICLSVALATGVCFIVVQ